MAVPERIRELRYLSGTTFKKTHTAADDATWAAGTATKLRITSFDASGLVYAGEEDPTLESQWYHGRPNIPTLRNGVLKFSMFGEGGESDGSANPLATLLSKIMGGLQAGAATDAADSSGTHTTTKVFASGIEGNVAPGQGILGGARGDGDMEAEVRTVSAEGTDYFEVPMAYSGAPVDTAAIVIGTTVFFDPTATQEYLDFLAIGKSAEDQLQTIAGMGSFTMEGLNPGEVPKFGFEINVADWQEVASGDRDQLEPTSTPSGNQPAVHRGMGGFFLGDNGTTTRAVYKAANVTVNPGIQYEAVPDLNGINGIGAWVKVAGTKPVVECDLLLEGSTDPLPGMYDDFANGASSTGAQAKQLIVQWGYTSQRCFAIDMPRCYFAAAPTRTTVGGLQAVHVVLEGAVPDLATESTANYLLYSPLRIHFF